MASASLHLRNDQLVPSTYCDSFVNSDIENSLCPDTIDCKFESDTVDNDILKMDSSNLFTTGADNNKLLSKSPDSKTVRYSTDLTDNDVELPELTPTDIPHSPTRTPRADEVVSDGASMSGSISDCASVGGTHCEGLKLTEDMVKEEEKIQEETVQEQEEYNKKRDEVMKDMTETVREERYTRLKFLLKKCNSYTDYLVVRMAENREIQTQREERRARKLEKRARKLAERSPQNKTDQQPLIPQQSGAVKTPERLEVVNIAKENSQKDETFKTENNSHKVDSIDLSENVTEDLCCEKSVPIISVHPPQDELPRSDDTNARIPRPTRQTSLLDLLSPKCQRSTLSRSRNSTPKLDSDSEENALTMNNSFTPNAEKSNIQSPTLRRKISRRTRSGSPKIDSQSIGVELGADFEDKNEMLGKENESVNDSDDESVSSDMSGGRLSRKRKFEIIDPNKVNLSDFIVGEAKRKRLKLESAQAQMQENKRYQEQTLKEAANKSPRKTRREVAAKNGTPTIQEGSQKSELMQEVPSQSPGIIQPELPSHSPGKIQEVPAQSPGVVQEVPAQSPGIMQEVPAQSPGIMQEVPAQSPGIMQEVPAQSPGIMQEVPAQSPGIMQEVPVQSPKIMQEVPAQSPGIIQDPELMHEVPTRSPGILQDVPAQDPELMHEVPTRSPGHSGEKSSPVLPRSPDENNNNQKEQEEEEADMRMINGEMVPVGQPLLFENGVLRKYQMDGFFWLKTMHENGVNGILADEMGLGKTVQVIATIAHLVKQHIHGSYMVIAPLSTLPNWMSEFKRFAPKLPVFLYHGSSRVALRKKLHDWYEIEGHPGTWTQNIIVTSYEMAMNDCKHLSKVTEWKYMVIDEGHRIKNGKCRLIQALNKFRIANRLLLTGTPLQNNMGELWSLLNFLLPLIFNDLDSFESWFDMEALQSEDSTAKIIAQEQRTNILSMLHQILTPFILRRLKQDVDLVIPPKREIMVYAPLTKLQRFYYAKAVNKTMEAFVKKKMEEKEKEKELELADGIRPKRGAAKRKVNYKAMMESEKDNDYESKQRFNDEDDHELDDWIQIMEENQKIITSSGSAAKLPSSSNLTINVRNTMMLLRKCVNHPYLLEYPLTECGEYRIDEDMVHAGGKLLILDKMLPELKRRGHKVLVFSQMTSVLDILQDYCYLREYLFTRLDGSMNLLQRQEQMDEFRSNPEIFLFLLSTKAGGLGLNLTAADTVIIYDSDWNPQGDLQAQDRCHRIGQTAPVVVYRLVTAGTIDQKMIEKAATKRKLEKMIIYKEKFKNTSENWTMRSKALDINELVCCLKSHEPDSVFDSHRQSVMSNRVLAQLLDRQDLYEEWMDNMERGGKGKKDKKSEKASLIPNAGVAGSYQIVAQNNDEQLRF